MRVSKREKGIHTMPFSLFFRMVKIFFLKLLTRFLYSTIYYILTNKTSRERQRESGKKEKISVVFTSS
jgi:hypothetical protein